MTLHRTAHAAWDTSEVDALVQSFAGHVSQYGVVLMDPAGKITGWSEGSFYLTGFTADDALGQDFALLFTPEDVEGGLHRHELNAAHTLGSADDERWHARKDGSVFWASGMTFSRRDGDRHLGYAKLFRDATPLRLRMRWLENEVQRLTQEQHDRGLFLGTIAHELRNPLQPMAMATRLLARPCEGAQQEQAVKILQRQLGFIERLVEDLIDMTRIGEGKLKLVHQKVELQPLLREAVEECRAAADAAGITLLSVLPPVPVMVEVDPGRLHQVVINLLNNAIKFTPSGGRVSVLANVDQTHFIVKVQDSGQGIGPELQPRIFDMFTQADGAGTDRGQGLGIGLALVKEIVSLHRGTVEVKSEGPDRGSEFMARLPLVKMIGN